MNDVYTRLLYVKEKSSMIVPLLLLRCPMLIKLVHLNDSGAWQELTFGSIVYTTMGYSLLAGRYRGCVVVFGDRCLCVLFLSLRP